MIRPLPSLGLLDRVLRILFPGVLFLLLNGCASVSYYGQLASGQLQLLRAREPVSSVIADPGRDQQLRAHLAQSQKARTFASQQLHLPDNQSYRLYADIGRPFVVWNVFATPEFSLTAAEPLLPHRRLRRLSRLLQPERGPR